MRHKQKPIRFQSQIRPRKKKYNISDWAMHDRCVLVYVCHYVCMCVCARMNVNGILFQMTNGLFHFFAWILLECLVKMRLFILLYKQRIRLPLWTFWEKTTTTTTIWWNEIEKILHSVIWLIVVFFSRLLFFFGWIRGYSAGFTLNDHIHTFTSCWYNKTWYGRIEY